MRVRTGKGRETAQWWGVNSKDGPNGIAAHLWIPEGDGTGRVFYGTTPKPVQFSTSAVEADKPAPRPIRMGRRKGEPTIDTGVVGWMPALVEPAVLGCHTDDGDDPQALALAAHLLRQPPDYPQALALPLPLHLAGLGQQYVMPTRPEEGADSVDGVGALADAARVPADPPEEESADVAADPDPARRRQRASPLNRSSPKSATERNSWHCSVSDRAGPVSVRSGRCPRSACRTAPRPTGRPRPIPHWPRVRTHRMGGGSQRVHLRPRHQCFSERRCVRIEEGGDTEVQDLHHPVRADHDVAALEVPVYDVAGVRGAQDGGDLHADRGGPLNGELAFLSATSRLRLSSCASRTMPVPPRPRGSRCRRTVRTPCPLQGLRPACGSGYFLVAAAHCIAEIRKGDPEDVRHAG